MRKLSLLLGIQWREIIRFQSLESDHPWLQKGLIVILGVVGIIYLGGYCYLMTTILAPLNLTLMIPSALLAMLSFLFIFMNMLKADNALIHPKDESILNPLPIPHTTILLSRLIVLYLFELATSLAAMVICLCAISLVDPLAIHEILTILLSIPLIPLLPFSLGLGLGILLQMISGHFRYARLMKILFTFMLLGGIFWVSAQISNEQDFTNLISVLTTKLNQIYPLCGLWLKVWRSFNLLSLLIIVFASSISILFTMFLAIYLAPLVQTHHFQTKQNTKLKKSTHSLLYSLYLLEIKRYWNSQIYVINTAFGPILMLAAVIYLRFQDLNTLFTILDHAQICTIVFVAFSIIIGLSTTTHVSISLEGKWYWIKRSLPISSSTYFISKILVTLTLTIPTSILSLLFLQQPLNLTLIDLCLLQIGILISCICFPIIGLVINLFFPKLKYTNEMIVVKQSLASLIMVGISFGLGLLPLGLMYLTHEPMGSLFSGVSLQLLLGISSFVYLKKYGETQLLKIG